MDALWFREQAHEARLDVRRIRYWIKTHPTHDHTQQKRVIAALLHRARKNVALARRLEKGDAQVVISGITL